MPSELEFFDGVLNEYRKVWNNRLLIINGKSSDEILKEAIIRELLDENSHPRVRKNRYEKYFAAIKRITGSNLTPESKVYLIEVHNQLMEELNNEK
ncbi:hypothetical protein BIV60_11325 [Bacillus sp. MUM 116]|uniref:hypothetical protein n=1 Tax=Bacillus sp. MUM 116 TaxID=1678002 RepID=UPI0008F5846E|nr:hypothetical protein [Bacillus sp. MUM 116]OIK14550.1 hypothetical protein BIV60_11325 [Bacillus sp. MUM 116]